MGERMRQTTTGQPGIHAICCALSRKIAVIVQTTFSNAFLKWKCWNSNTIWRTFGPKSPIDNIPLSESMMVSLLTHLCATRPQSFTGWFVLVRPMIMSWYWEYNKAKENEHGKNMYSHRLFVKYYVLLKSVNDIRSNVIRKPVYLPVISVRNSIVIKSLLVVKEMVSEP